MLIAELENMIALPPAIGAALPLAVVLGSGALSSPSKALSSLSKVGSAAPAEQGLELRMFGQAAPSSSA
eukprot:1597023-Lingulodinium_polyedra.AAC.1